MLDALADTKSSTFARETLTISGESAMRKSVAFQFDVALQQFLAKATGRIRNRPSNADITNILIQAASGL